LRLRANDRFPWFHRHRFLDEEGRIGRFAGEVTGSAQCQMVFEPPLKVPLADSMSPCSFGQGRIFGQKMLEESFGLQFWSRFQPRLGLEQERLQRTNMGWRFASSSGKSGVVFTQLVVL
jgi:hypothetical protein